MGFKIKAPKIKSIGGAFALGGNALSLGSLSAISRAAGVGGKGGDQPGGVDPTPGPKFAMRNTNEFMQETQAPKLQRIDVSQTFSPLNQAAQKRYGLMRDRIGADANSAMQKQSDALTRRFAAMGSTGSGAAIKMQQQAMEEGERQKADAMKGVDVVEQEEALQRDSQAAQMQAGFDQQTNLAQADMDFKAKVFSFERGSKLHELDLAERQQQIDSNTTDFNKRIAAEQAKPPKQGMFSSLLSDWI